MRFTLTVAMCPPEDVLPMARAAESVGFGGVAVPDSVFFPKEVSADYPYTADGSRFWNESTPFVDPLIAIPAMAAATSQIRFVTNVLKAPLRHPVLLAKSIGTLEAMFPSRLALGVGLSWIPEEFAWLGLAMSQRGIRLDETIETLRDLLRSGWVEHHGRLFDAGPLTMSPAPDACPPILVGGHSEPALLRAARLGDGWVSAMVSVEETAAFIDRLSALRSAAGRSESPFEIVATPTIGPDVDSFVALATMGVTEVIVAPWFYYGARSLEEKLESIERFAGEVVSAVNDRVGS